MIRRYKIGFIYFAIVLATLLLRVASALDIYGALGVSDSDAFYSCVVQILIFGVMPLSLYFLTVGQDNKLAKFRADFGVRKISPKNCLRVLVLAICMIVVSHGVSYVWQSVLSLIGFTRVPSSTDYSTVGALFKQLALVAVLPAIFEEITHRGLIYAGYRECGWKFVLISGVYFSLMHQNIVQTGYTFFAGIVMALTMYYTRSMFMHFLNNAVSVIGGYISQNGGVFSFVTTVENWIYSTLPGLAVGCVAVVACAAALVFIFVRMRKDAERAGAISGAPFEKVQGVLPLRKDAPFIATVAVGIVAAIFSLAWGLMR